MSRWTALRGGVSEGLALSNTFKIGPAGTLELPIIGSIRAAGLRASELEQLITDRLQKRSGFHERPLTTVTKVQRKIPDKSSSVEGSATADTGSAPASAERSSAAADKRAEVDGKSPLARHATGSHAGAAPPQTDQQTVLEQDRSRTTALERELALARMEAQEAREELLVAREAARYEALQYNQLLTAERQTAAALSQELGLVRADLEEAKAQAKAAWRVDQAWEAEANKQREQAARERAKSADLEKKLLVARKEIDTLKDTTHSLAAHEEALRRELAAANEQRDATRHAADVASAQARALAEAAAKQESVREELRQRAERLARDLGLAQREVESLKLKGGLAMSENALVHRARQAAEAALAEATRALEDERRRTGVYERDLSTVRQAIDALEARAKLAATALASAQATEAAAKQTTEALALERVRTDSVARALETTRQELANAKEELSRLSAAQQKALEQERDRVSALSRDLSQARQQIDSLKARAARQTIDTPPKTRAADRARPRANTPARKVARQAKERKPQRTVRFSKVLPDALLPTQPALPGQWP